MKVFDNLGLPRIRVWEPGNMPGWYMRIEWTADDATEEEADDSIDLGRVFLDWKKNELGLMWLKLWFAPYP